MVGSKETTTPPAWWRRTPAVVAVVVLILGVELVIGWPSLAEALRQLRAPAWNWVAGAVIAEIASMSTYARMQQALLRGAGTAAFRTDERGDIAVTRDGTGSVRVLTTRR